MKQAVQKAVKAERTAAQAPDPRSNPAWAAFARLLARHAARQDFEKGLNQTQDGAYDSDSPAGDDPS